MDSRDNTWEDRVKCKCKGSIYVRAYVLLKMGHGCRTKGWNSSSTCLQSLQWIPIQFRDDYLTRITKSNTLGCRHPKESRYVLESIVQIPSGTCSSFSKLEEFLSWKKPLRFKRTKTFLQGFWKENFLGWVLPCICNDCWPCRHFWNTEKHYSISLLLITAVFSSEL